MVNKVSKKAPLALALLAVLGLVGCAGGAQAVPGGDEPIELEFVTWQLEEAGIQDWWTAVIDEFESEHDGVTIVPRHVDGNDMAEFVTTRFAADSAPAILHLPTEVFAVFAEEGWLEELDSRLADTDIPQTWPETQSLMEWDGTTQGLMVFGYSVQLFYNEQLLEEAGQSVPTTSEELVAVAKALTEGDVYGYGSVTTQHRDLFRQASSYVVGFGGAWAKDGEYQFTSTEVVAALENYREVSKFSPQGISSDQKRELFFQGKVAMMLDGPFNIPALADAAPEVKDYVKVARSPFDAISYYPANGLHIPSTGTDREKDLAWDFLELSASAEMQDLFVELYQSPAARAGAGSEAEVSPLLEEFITGSAESVGIIPSSASIRANFGTFDRLVQDGLMEMLTSDRSISDIFADVEERLLSEDIQP
ncbi:ABC transporter substrate-binding protein [Cryobacterium sp. Y11]|uniref:ABC transporter substrate-binding protein n=1 Tax=Cryobacterium sp. Y11 TaxID=2045016 RepID=UPI000CE422CD|nr:extracellular solute-binding protein [Cryobacterium sp. Y11]